jgi:hypothetical protein
MPCTRNQPKRIDTLRVIRGLSVHPLVVIPEDCAKHVQAYAGTKELPVAFTPYHYTSGVKQGARLLLLTVGGHLEEVEINEGVGAVFIALLSAKQPKSGAWGSHPVDQALLDRLKRAEAEVHRLRRAERDPSSVGKADKGERFGLLEIE